MSQFMQRPISLSLSDLGCEKLQFFWDKRLVVFTANDGQNKEYTSDYSCQMNSTGQFYNYNNGIWARAINSTFLTEKTAVALAVAVRDRSISDQNTFHDIAKYYSITKLMLLREMAAQYLSSDILITLFDMTE
jgi:hypothetical protein